MSNKFKYHFFPQRTKTQGHTARRTAVDYGVPLITDVKCAKMLVAAMYKLGRNVPPKVDMSVDAISAGRVVRLPGNIMIYFLSVLTKSIVFLRLD